MPGLSGGVVTPRSSLAWRSPAYSTTAWIVQTASESRMSAAQMKQKMAALVPNRSSPRRPTALAHDSMPRSAFMLSRTLAAFGLRYNGEAESLNWRANVGGAE